jgi:transcriptional regulator GlxA family with amidase domain
MRAEIVIFDGFEDLDAFGPANVLAVAGIPVRLVTHRPREVVVSALGTRVAPAGTLSGTADVVVVPGGGWLNRAEHGTWAEVERGDLPKALATVAEQGGGVMASVCSGAFLLAAAGLLAGRPAVTNAAALDELAAAGALVQADARVVDDGDVVTSGGLTAGIDLGLWLVERTHGADHAREVARRLEHTRAGLVRRRLAAAPDVVREVARIELPQSELARAALAAAREVEPEHLLNHSVRSYLFARLAAAARAWAPGRDYDDEVLFAACVLHDIGLTPSADTGARFEVDGADAAAAVLRTHGMAAERVALVWDAIALHTSVGIAERSRPEVSLTRAGIAMDFGHDADLVPDDVADAIHDALPRLDLARRITDDIVGQAHGRPGKALPGTFAGELVRERATPPHVTGMEQGAWAGRWGA